MWSNHLILHRRFWKFSVLALIMLRSILLRLDVSHILFLITSASWLLFQCFRAKRFFCNSKFEWAIQETDWLGYWLTPSGLKLWSKKFKVIKVMQAPFNTKQVHLFIGAYTYCCDMWPWKSYILAPFADLSGKGKFYWTLVHQKAFDAIKARMVKDVLLWYLDHTLTSHICTRASDYQLGSLIVQQNLPGAYHTCKIFFYRTKLYHHWKRNNISSWNFPHLFAHFIGCRHSCLHKS